MLEGTNSSNLYLSTVDSIGVALWHVKFSSVQSYYLESIYLIVFFSDLILPFQFHMIRTKYGLV